ncbi:hypothetical protein OPV22_033599 [Ensete ventricosum]|uniref:Uncharacterized protein n=1 Tax=Ensete ventricosum TaxID=4639 RepID=A0AAV8PUQ9_ENSVE|nr:hypothetical protein OPV22_033599 [Ensete ventricosum]
MSYESHGVPPAISNHTASDKLQVDFHVILAEDREIFQVQSYPRATLQLLWNPLYSSPSQGGDGGASSESHAWRSDAAIVSDSSSFAYLECGVGVMKTDAFKDYISISCSSLPSSCDHCSMVCRRNHPSKLPPGHAPPTDADQVWDSRVTCKLLEVSCQIWMHSLSKFGGSMHVSNPTLNGPMVIKTTIDLLPPYTEFFNPQNGSGRHVGDMYNGLGFGEWIHA